MKEKTYYYPRHPFWAFWQKRNVKFTISISDAGETHRFFDEDGWLSRLSLVKTNGEVECCDYYPNGQMSEKTVQNKNGYSCFRWDWNGQSLGGEKYNYNTGIKTIFHSNGEVKIRHNKSTGTYEEFFDNGKLKRKGLWVNYDGTIADDIRNSCSSFETGNMRAKTQNEKRQDYNQVIETINEILPPTSGRKMAKEALLKAFLDSSHTR